MADTVKTTVLHEDDTVYLVEFTSRSDGEGEPVATKINVSELTPPAATVSIDQITWSVNGAPVDILWDATTDVLAWTLGADTHGYINLVQSRGSLFNTKATGYTGDVNFSVAAGLAKAGYGYSITLKCTKFGHNTPE